VCEAHKLRYVTDVRCPPGRWPQTSASTFHNSCSAPRWREAAAEPPCNADTAKRKENTAMNTITNTPNNTRKPCSKFPLLPRGTKSELATIRINPLISSPNLLQIRDYPLKSTKKLFRLQSLTVRSLCPSHPTHHPLLSRLCVLLALCCNAATKQPSPFVSIRVHWFPRLSRLVRALAPSSKPLTPPRVTHAACVKISLAGVLRNAHPVDNTRHHSVGTASAQ
jgi:hypothetical protein